MFIELSYGLKIGNYVPVDLKLKKILYGFNQLLSVSKNNSSVEADIMNPLLQGEFKLEDEGYPSKFLAVDVIRETDGTINLK